MSRESPNPVALAIQVMHHPLSVQQCLNVQQGSRDSGMFSVLRHLHFYLVKSVIALNRYGRLTSTVMHVWVYTRTSEMAELDPERRLTAWYWQWRGLKESSRFTSLVFDPVWHRVLGIPLRILERMILFLKLFGSWSIVCYVHLICVCV